MSVLDDLRNGLVVSCQPIKGGPMDTSGIIAAMASAAQAGGAAGIRIEGGHNLNEVRPFISIPIIAIKKRELDNSAVRITPFPEDVVYLASLGADVIAYDATQRPRPVATREIVQAIHDSGKVSMADCATLDDGRQALAEGASILSTTLSGYAYDLALEGTEPDLALVTGFRMLEAFVMAEGRYNHPNLAGQAMAAGADCVTVGSAITRVEHITSWFVQSVKTSARE